MTCRPAGAKEGLREHAAGWSGYHARQHATDTRAGQTANDSTLVVSQKRSFNHEVACQQSIEQVRQSRRRAGWRRAGRRGTECGSEWGPRHLVGSEGETIGDARTMLQRILQRMLQYQGNLRYRGKLAISRKTCDIEENLRDLKLDRGICSHDLHARTGKTAMGLTLIGGPWRPTYYKLALRVVGSYQTTRRFRPSVTRSPPQVHGRPSGGCEKLNSRPRTHVRSVLCLSSVKTKASGVLWSRPHVCM